MIMKFSTLISGCKDKIFAGSVNKKKLPFGSLVYYLRAF